ncbi:MAG: DJ-1/PfpI family protein [Gracilimonas sp.]|uniref:DJ-1/PfpI family protein n=1 Tax=Gracilimonas sp. TaxID=1974203 RepID=UPI001B235B4B|nr:DJ-1/PfpI family protein [Gracilimonas sp.]MBO6586147.1 DJ-1/PfpI family protein [Gracilimonas sp.]MBO6614804.1 DJ-1/PfpI family protein [Gracilimonas sp.]
MCWVVILYFNSKQSPRSRVMNGYFRNWLSLLTIIRKQVIILFLAVPLFAFGQSAKPNVAILVYDGVQVIDHAIPFEVFGQFSLNNVYLVSQDSLPVTTYMGMKVVPNYSFTNAPTPDVLVLPGGDAGEAQNNEEVKRWINLMVEESDHILTVCTGIFFLTDNDILSGKQVTTWYDRQEELQRITPDAEVVTDRVVVESGKLVSSAGLGIDGSLRVLARLHGEAWAEVVRLNMEHESIPQQHHIPRAKLADLKLPSGIYAAFPWREAELKSYKGDRHQWTMAWAFNSQKSLDSLIAGFKNSLYSERGWTFVSDTTTTDEWKSNWTIEDNSDSYWKGIIRLQKHSEKIDLNMSVKAQQVN